MSYTQDFITSEEEQLNKLQQIVQKAIVEEKPIFDNLVYEPKEILTKGQTIADKVASFGRSWKFIISFSIILSVEWYIISVSRQAQF